MLLDGSQAFANVLYIWLSSRAAGVLNIPVTHPQCILPLGENSISEPLMLALNHTYFALQEQQG